ncbi:hypothetical protein ACJ6WD_39905 [Streptomyces sp. VTCC 41912]|uniref:hypothetical protein n=1 Tax=Streptomyces sp. VTCC 41912 TaxID=3383243 RepID=UPI003896C901
MTEIPEDAKAETLRVQAAALRAVREAGAPRVALLKQADEELNETVKPVVLAAARTGAAPSRIRAEAHIGTSLLYRWMEEAGIPIRAKKQTPKIKP